jgi:hypothetical protein
MYVFPHPCSTADLEKIQVVDGFFGFAFQTGSYCVTQDGLKLTAFCLSLPSVGIIDITMPEIIIFYRSMM